MHIGLDLDNTIIDYNGAFPAVAETLGLLDENHGLTDKAAVKAALLAVDGGLDQWMRLQGQVYGPCLDRARPFADVDAFLGEATRRGHHVSIVSHKTEFGHYDESRTHLWQAARSWLANAGIVGSASRAIDERDVFFETTRAAKIRRIGAIGCDVFVDDLIEVLTDSGFPRHVTRVWFTGSSAGERPAHTVDGLTPVGRWRDMMAVIDRTLATTSDCG